MSWQREKKPLGMESRQTIAPEETGDAASPEVQKVELSQAVEPATAESPPAATDQTVAFPPAPATPDSHDTIHFSPSAEADPGATLDPDSPNTGICPSALDATVDFPPEQKFDPDQTVDPEQMTAQEETRTAPSVAGVELGATINFPKASPDVPGLTMDSAAAAALLSPDRGFSLNLEAQGRGAAGQPLVLGYEILSELGRGGMGVVYKARQFGLNRLVALKMVLAGAHAGATQLARFHTEAEAVAHLLHPNIVQIYEVGNHDGLPYFSLEYVDGGSLADKIAGQPQKVKEAAQMIEILALAMAFAHQHGIIHRDLKPANVLMTRDGLPKITDFGLAKRLEDDSSQTKSGTLMGTPNYMAPEQAHGKVSEMGPLTDVYALGVILYEMLTGRTPFMGASVLETLELVRSEEPVPPSRLQPKVPADIETICLKCLQKEPGKRYRDADALARDLHHFLNGEPIEARPVGNVERLWRWCKRNPRIAAMTATIFGLLVAGVTGSTIAAVTIARERNQKELERQAAEEARNVATEQVALALDTVKTLIHQVQDQLENAPRTQPLKKALLQTAADGLEQVRQRAKGSTSNEVAIAFAAVDMKMGLVYRQLGETEEAFKYVLESHKINQEQAKVQPESDRAKSNLAASYTVLAEMSLEMRRDLAASLDYYQKALKLREELYQHPHDQEGAPKPKSVKQGLAETYIRVGATVLRKGDPAKARDYFQKALQLREELAADYPDDNGVLQDLARSYHAVGEMCLRLQQTELGKQYFGKCLKLRERLFQANPNDLKLKQELARWCGTLGELAERSRDYSEALRHYQRSVDLNRELVEIDPKNVDYQRDLGTAYYQLATAYLQTKDMTAAAKYFHECLKIRQARADAEPQNSRRQMELIGVLPHCGEHVKAAAAAEKLRQSKPKDQEILIAIGCCYACCSAAPEAGELRQHYADKSIEALNQSVALGFKDLSFFEIDPDLDPVRKEPGFLKLLEKLKKH
jgi:serine/threonine protein kinase/tetratricopeptide (TPR) repeat protein